MKVGDKVVGKIIGLKKIADMTLVHVMFANTVTLGTVLKESDLKIIEGENKNSLRRLNNGMVITNDGYLICPYSSGVECSIYLKNSCKSCSMNKEKSF